MKAIHRRALRASALWTETYRFSLQARKTGLRLPRIARLPLATNCGRTRIREWNCRQGEASLHLGSMTALSFLNLDENILQARIAEGAVNFRVRESFREGDLYEVDTPNAAFTVKEAGAFRVDVNENGDGTRITVIRGEGEITAGGKTYDVHAGEQAELNGVDDPEYNVGSAPAPDDLDRWAAGPRPEGRALRIGEICLARRTGLLGFR